MGSMPEFQGPGSSPQPTGGSGRLRNPGLCGLPTKPVCPLQLVTACAMQAFHSLFHAKPGPGTLPAELNAQIVTVRPGGGRGSALLREVGWSCCLSAE